MAQAKETPACEPLEATFASIPSPPLRVPRTGPIPHTDLEPAFVTASEVRQSMQSQLTDGR